MADFGQISRKFAEDIVRLFQRVRLLESKLSRAQNDKFPPSRCRIGKANAAIAINATGAVSWWYGTPGSESDTNVDFDAYNRFGAIDSGAWVWCEDNGSGWYITQAVCPA